MLDTSSSPLLMILPLTASADQPCPCCSHVSTDSDDAVVLHLCMKSISKQVTGGLGGESEVDDSRGKRSKRAMRNQVRRTEQQTTTNWEALRASKMRAEVRSKLASKTFRTRSSPQHLIVAEQL
eukprot:749768-Hanusia_phi.AAC.5